MKYYFYGCVYKDCFTGEKKMTEYSELFENIEDSKTWYNDYGIKLEKMFNRVLVPSIRKKY